MSLTLNTDIAIIGGGIAGLWLNAQLRQRGFNTLLIEKDALGGGQSVKSQGIIHGGAKYALHGALSGSSEAIADMPDRWRKALNGEGELDLRGVRLLSDAHYLWSPGSIAGNLTSFFASKAMRGRVDQVKGQQLPAALQDKDFKGRVYRLAELVLDVPSLVQRLVELAGNSILHAQKITPRYANQQLVGVHADNYTINAQRVVLCAGNGNQALLQAFELNKPEQQLRPLHMVLAKGPTLLPLYAHCLGGGSKPRVTITTHPAADGQWVWYLGGNLAEADGVARSAEQQIKAAQTEIAQLLPWIAQDTTQWATLRVDRAEPVQSGLVRPDNAFISEHGALLVGWPTKLALAPDFSDRVLKLLERDDIQPSTVQSYPELPRPALAQPIWETVFNDPA
ncbi:MAG TPA: FAD-dependent oxidoreductase [Gammaproteobacteria bacterium]|nr:FAD-dependent oxidoreductase [Gammaproteobacteria bacterium]